MKYKRVSEQNFIENNFLRNGKEAERLKKLFSYWVLLTKILQLRTPKGLMKLYLLHLKIEIIGKPWKKKEEKNQPETLMSPSHLHGGVLPEKLGGLCSVLPETLALFQTKTCDFSFPFSEPTQEIVTLPRLQFA